MERDVDAHHRSLLGRGANGKGALQVLGSFPHTHQSYSLARHTIVFRAHHEARAVVPDFEAQATRLLFGRDPSFLGAGVAGDVVQSFLDNSIKMDSFLRRIEAIRKPAIVVHLDAGLL